MVTGNSIDNHWVFFILTCQFCPNLNVTSFHFTVNRFTDIMQEPCTSCQSSIFTQLTGNNTRKFGNFNGVTQNVLTIRSTELQPSHDFHQIWMEVWRTNFIGSRLTVFTNTIVNFLTVLLNQLFDAGWMDATIFEKALHCHTGNFTTNRIKP